MNLSPETTVALIIGAGIVLTVIFIALFEHFAVPMSDDTGDETRTIDILKRGEICPWPRDF